MKIELGRYKCKPVFVDLDAAMNQHSFFVGGTGSGKTTEAQKMMCEICEQGGTILAIDLHGSLENDQIFWKYRSKFNRCMHSFDAYMEAIPCEFLEPIQYADGTSESPVDTANAVANAFGRILNLGCNQRGVLRSAIEYVIEAGTYDTLGFCGITDALEKIGNSTAKSIRDKLHQLERHNIFRPGDGFMHDGKINIIRLGKYDLETQEILSELLLAYVWRLALSGKFKENGIFVFLDEMQNLQSGRHSALAQMLAEGRKFGLNLLLATQQLAGCSTLIQHRLAQCALTLYFRPGTNCVNTTAKMIDPLSESEWSLILRTLKRGEFVATGALEIDGRLYERPLKISAFEEAGEDETVNESKRGRGTVRM